MTSKGTLQQAPVCPKCQSKYTVKKGKRRNRLRTLQIFQCAECQHKFTGSVGKNKTYPLETILDVISTFNLGHALTETQTILRRRGRLDIPERTISSWVAAYRDLTTYSRLRNAGKRLFRPDQVVQTQTLNHQQVYRFQLHRAKLELLLASTVHQHLRPVRDYLIGIAKSFPHKLFETADHRSSKFPAELVPSVVRKENRATRLAALVLPTSPTNKKRHETLQRFMLINDSATMAVEVPVYLKAGDIAYFRSRGFALGFDSEVITGHIDSLQIRNRYLHILDYKPAARKEKHARVQLTIYALALSRRTRLPLKHFKCAWFDEIDYFEFFPLQAVYRPDARCTEKVELERRAETPWLVAGP